MPQRQSTWSTPCKVRRDTNLGADVGLGCSFSWEWAVCLVRQPWRGDFLVGLLQGAESVEWLEAGSLLLGVLDVEQDAGEVLRDQELHEGAATLAPRSLSGLGRS